MVLYLILAVCVIIMSFVTGHTIGYWSGFMDGYKDKGRLEV